MPVRRSSLIAVTVVAILGSLLVSPAGARVVAGDAGRATVESSSTAAVAALRNVRAVFNGELPGGRLLPVPGVPAHPAAYDATLALRDLALLKDELTGGARVEAERYLARPSEPGDRDAYTVAEAPPACSGPVCVHYVASSGDAPDLTDGNGNGRPDYVDTVLATTIRVHNTFVAAGYRAPKPDRGIGGGNQTDIYIADIADNGRYGYCTTDQNIPPQGPYDTWAYCVVDDDYKEFRTNTPLENLQVTVAHEYFHAVQFGYDIAEDSWFLEATAAWMEDELYDDVDDNLQYLVQSPLRLPRVPMDTFAASFYYGTWIFFRYLSERYPASQGGLPTVVRDMWRKADSVRGAPDQYSIQAVKSVLKARGTEFPELFAKFSAANRRPAQTYSEGRVNKYRPAPLARSLRLGKGQSKGDTIEADHLTSATVRFRPSPRVRGQNAKLRIRVDMAPARRGSAAVASIKLRSGKVRVVPIRLKGSGTGVKTLAFSVRKVKHVELTLANAGTNYDCLSGGPYSCQGTSRNDDTKETFRATVIGG
jgi:hypothetical protein